MKRLITLLALISIPAYGKCERQFESLKKAQHELEEAKEGKGVAKDLCTLNPLLALMADQMVETCIQSCQERLQAAREVYEACLAAPETKSDREYREDKEGYEKRRLEQNKKTIEAEQERKRKEALEYERRKRAEFGKD